MLFNDYVRSLNKQYQELIKLNGIIRELKQILVLEEQWNDSVFRSCYLKKIHNGYDSSSISNAQNLCKNSEVYFNRLRESLISIDFLEFGEVLSNFKNEGIKELKTETDTLVNDLKALYSEVHMYRKFTEKDKRVDYYVNCIEAIRKMVEKYNRFINLVNNINSINNKLCESIEGEGLEIQLLNHGITKDTYPYVVNSVCTIYEKLCEITNVKEEIIIARVETGSLFAKFLGNKNILKLVAKILNTSHDMFVREYTREGQKKNLVESTELFKQQFDIVKEMESMGMDVSGLKEISNETLVLIMKKSNLLLSTSPDIRINEKTLSKSEDVKKLLEANDYKLLTVTKDENVEDDDIE